MTWKYANKLGQRVVWPMTWQAKKHRKNDVALGLLAPAGNTIPQGQKDQGGAGVEPGYLLHF